MVTISHIIRDVLDRHVLLQEAFSQNIVSYNKLANILKPEIEEELGRSVKHNAIVMALRRNSEKLVDPTLRPSFSYSIETIRTDIFYIVMEESPRLLNKIAELYSVIDFKKGGLLNIIQGNCEVAIITNNKYRDKLLDIFGEENILETIEDLVSISLTYSKNFLLTPGIIYDITRYITWENINIIDIILTKTELNLIVGRKDLMKCYKTLGRFSEKTGKAKENFSITE